MINTELQILGVFKWFFRDTQNLICNLLWKIVKGVTLLCIHYGSLPNIYDIVILFLIVGFLVVLLLSGLILDHLIASTDFPPLLPYGSDNCHFVICYEIW